MATVTLNTVCAAVCHETWEVEVDDELLDGDREDLIDTAMGKLFAGNAEIVGEKVDGEEDRELVSAQLADGTSMRKEASQWAPT